MIFAIILLVLLALSLFGNFAQYVARAISSGFSRGSFRTSLVREVGPRLEECMLKDYDATYKIAVVTVDGIITDNTQDQAGNSMVDVIKAQLDRAKEDRPRQSGDFQSGFARRRGDGLGRNQQCHREFPEGRAGGTGPAGQTGQTGDLLDGQPGGVGRLLHFRAEPLDCGERSDPHRQHRRHYAHVELSRT